MKHSTCTLKFHIVYACVYVCNLIYLSRCFSIRAFRSRRMFCNSFVFCHAKKAYLSYSSEWIMLATPNQTDQPMNFCRCQHGMAFDKSYMLEQYRLRIKIGWRHDPSFCNSNRNVWYQNVVVHWWYINYITLLGISPMHPVYLSLLRSGCVNLWPNYFEIKTILFICVLYLVIFVCLISRSMG